MVTGLDVGLDLHCCLLGRLGRYLVIARGVAVIMNSVEQLAPILHGFGAFANSIDGLL